MKITKLKIEKSLLGCHRLNYPLVHLDIVDFPVWIIELNVNWDYGYILKARKIKVFG